MKRNHLRLQCPHCHSRLGIRSSVGLTATYREIYVHCTNDECGFRGRGQIEITHTLCPSQQPSDVTLPLSPGIRDTLLAQLLPETN